MKILIIDDVAFMLISLRQLLERNKHVVITATSGDNALEILATDFTIDVVITDLIMPEMDGVTLYLRAEQIERFNDTGPIPAPPFVLLTSCEKSGNRAEWDAAIQIARRQFRGILQKPVAQGELLPLLESIEEEIRAELSGSGGESEVIKILRKTMDDLQNAGNTTAAEMMMAQIEAELEKEAAANGGESAESADGEKSGDETSTDGESSDEKAEAATAEPAAT